MHRQKQVEGKKQDQQYQSKENKAFNNAGKQKNKPLIIIIKIVIIIITKRRIIHQYQQAQPQKRKEKELPAKITFSESLTVAELAKKTAS